MIGFQLIDQSDAPAFLTHIQQYTPAFFLNPAQSFRQLLATVTTQGTESIPGETFGMYPAQYRFAVSDVPFYKGNVMFSFISSEPDVQKMFRWAMGKMADVLRDLGIDATLSGRNDIIVDGRKVAGAAFYRVAGRGIMHNTLLFKSDVSALQNALTPSKEKLKSKGVASVSQRVANVADYLPGMTVEEFKEHARRVLCGDNYREITMEDMEEIRKTQELMGRKEWIYGRMPQHTEVRKLRLPDVGSVEVYLEIKDGKILDLNLVGDFFIMGDVDGEIISPLRHQPFTREGVAAALQGHDLSQVVRGLTTEGWLQVLFG